MTHSQWMVTVSQTFLSEKTQHYPGKNVKTTLNFIYYNGPYANVFLLFCK